MKIFFTSDTHFGHGNILQHCQRPFSSIHEHDETLITNWNSVIQKNDVVYHLGDFALCSPDYAISIKKRLNGDIHLIEGNHDKTAKQIQNSQKCRKFTSVQQMKVINHLGTRIVMCHYALRTWSGCHKGGIHLFGHSHGRMPPLGKSFDVGVDCTNFYPLSFEQVLEIASKLETKPFGDEIHDK